MKIVVNINDITLKDISGLTTHIIPITININDKTIDV